MTTNQQLEPARSLADQAAQTADRAVQSTQRLAGDAMDSLASTAKDVRAEAAPLLNRATEQVSALAQRGMDSARETSQQLREGAQRASDSTVNYIKEEPVKAMLIAAAVGAALMGILSLAGSGRR